MPNELKLMSNGCKKKHDFKALNDGNQFVPIQFRGIKKVIIIKVLNHLSTCSFVQTIFAIISTSTNALKILFL